MRVARLSPVLASLVTKLEPLVRAIEAKGPPRDVFANLRFPIEERVVFGRFGG
jgi:hypothetical protein